MGTLFIKLLNMSIAAGWIVLAVILIRTIFRKGPKWMRCLLWAVVAVRLIVPVLPESPFSLIPSGQTIVISEEQSREDPEKTGTTSQDQHDLSAATDGTATQTVIPDWQSVPRTPGPQEREQTDTPGTSLEIISGIHAFNSTINPVVKEAVEEAKASVADPVSRWKETAGIIWISGAVLLFCYAAFSYIKLRRRVSASVPQADGIYICDDIPSPFILGVIRPKIFLPSGLSGAESGHVIAHEKAHLARRDHLWKPLGFALLIIYWFNPLIWAAYILFCRDIEYACDEKVVATLESSGRASYSTALLSCSVPRRTISACPLAFGETGTKSRIKSVLNYRKPVLWVIIAAVVICIVVAVCFLTDPQGRSSKQPKLPSEPPLLTVIGSETVSVKRMGCSWTNKKGAGATSVIEDSAGIFSEEHRKEVKSIGEYNGKIVLDFSVWPNDISVSIISEKDLLTITDLTNGMGDIPLTVNDDHLFSIDNVTDAGRHYCIVFAEWRDENGSGGTANYYFSVDIP